MEADEIQKGQRIAAQEKVTRWRKKPSQPGGRFHRRGSSESSSEARSGCQGSISLQVQECEAFIVRARRRITNMDEDRAAEEAELEEGRGGFALLLSLHHVQHPAWTAMRSLLCPVAVSRFLAEDFSSILDGQGTLQVVAVPASGSAVECSRVAHVLDQSVRDRRSCIGRSENQSARWRKI